jgi:hypothetical protein
MIARIPIARPIAGPTPLATPTIGRTNGNTRYITMQRQAVIAIDFWNADRASALVEVFPSGSLSRRRMKRSADELDCTRGASEEASVVVSAGALTRGERYSLIEWSAHLQA